MLVALARWWARWWPGRRVGNPGFGNQPAVAVVELQVAGGVGVAVDGELAAVMSVVMVGAQRGQVVCLGRSGRERFDVVDLEVGGRVTAWASTGAVAVHHHP